MAAVDATLGIVGAVDSRSTPRAALASEWCWPRPAPRVLLGFELICAWCRAVRLVLRPAR
jgi:hypothetical protein